MTRTTKELTIAQDVLESLISFCKRNNKEGLDIAELRATIVTLELEKMNNV